MAISSKSEPKLEDPDMLPEYDFSGGVRGKYAAQYAQDDNAIKQEMDGAAIEDEAEDWIPLVNQALEDIHANKGMIDFDEFCRQREAEKATGNRQAH